MLIRTLAIVGMFFFCYFCVVRAQQRDLYSYSIDCMALTLCARRAMRMDT